MQSQLVSAGSCRGQQRDGTGAPVEALDDLGQQPRASAGSEQPLHSDAFHMTTQPPGYLTGGNGQVWQVHRAMLERGHSPERVRKIVGLNLLQSSITGFCPAAVIFRRPGVSNGCAFR